MLKKLEQLCRKSDFDEAEAITYIKQLDINQEFKESRYSSRTTFLALSAEHSNIKMTELLLQNGADPNQIYDVSESVLWNMQYVDEDENLKKKLKITQLLLEHGADPNINPENGAENLFEYILYKVFNEYSNFGYEYILQFFILLVAYGGKSDPCTPKIVKPFDKTNIQQYRLFFVPEGDSHYSGKIVDTENNIIAYI